MWSRVRHLHAWLGHWLHVSGNDFGVWELHDHFAGAAVIPLGGNVCFAGEIGMCGWGSGFFAGE